METQHFMLVNVYRWYSRIQENVAQHNLWSHDRQFSGSTLYARGDDTVIVKSLTMFNTMLQFTSENFIFLILSEKIIGSEVF